MLALRRYTHSSPESQYFLRLELDSMSSPCPQCQCWHRYKQLCLNQQADHPRSKKCRNIWQALYKMRGVISARFKNTLLFYGALEFLHGQFKHFFLAGAVCLSADHHLRPTRGPAGNRTTTGSLSASSRTTPYQLSHEDTYSTASSSRKKHTQTHQALRVYGGGGVGRRTTPWHLIAEPSLLGSATSATFGMSTALGLARRTGAGHCQPSGDL